MRLNAHRVAQGAYRQILINIVLQLFVPPMVCCRGTSLSDRREMPATLQANISLSRRPINEPGMVIGPLEIHYNCPINFHTRYYHFLNYCEV